MVKPYSRSYHKQIKNHLPQYVANQLDFSLETNRLLRDLLSLHIQKEINLENGRRLLQDNYI